MLHWNSFWIEEEGGNKKLDKHMQSQSPGRIWHTWNGHQRPVTSVMCARAPLPARRFYLLLLFMYFFFLLLIGWLALHAGIKHAPYFSLLLHLPHVFSDNFFPSPFPCYWRSRWSTAPLRFQMSTFCVDLRAIQLFENVWRVGRPSSQNLFFFF